MEKVFAAAEEKMGKTVSVLSSEYAAIRAGRANASVLDKIKVDYYGTPTPINQMAAVSVAEARILTIQPWDTSTLHAIEKAIQTSASILRMTAESSALYSLSLQRSAARSFARMSRIWLRMQESPFVR